jgi:hypothetical protein
MGIDTRRDYLADVEHMCKVQSCAFKGEGKEMEMEMIT